MWHAILIRIPHINMKERDTALDILIDYEKNESYLNITLNHTLTQDFSPSERGLITTLVYSESSISRISIRTTHPYSLKSCRENASINEPLPAFLFRYTRLCDSE